MPVERYELSKFEYDLSRLKTQVEFLWDARREDLEARIRRDKTITWVMLAAFWVVIVALWSSLITAAILAD